MRSAIAIHCGASSFQRLRDSARPIGALGMPKPSCTACSFGCLNAATISSAMRAWMSSGVPAGTHIGTQPSSANTGSRSPSSMKVGTSDSRGERSGPSAAIGRMAPR